MDGRWKWKRDHLKPIDKVRRRRVSAERTRANGTRGQGLTNDINVFGLAEEIKNKKRHRKKEDMNYNILTYAFGT